MYYVNESFRSVPKAPHLTFFFQRFSSIRSICHAVSFPHIVLLILFEGVLTYNYYLKAFIDQLKIRHLELIRILDESQTRAVREKTEFTLGEWNRVLSECQRRKSQLKKMADESRAWEQLRCSVQLWLNDAQQRFVIKFTAMLLYFLLMTVV